MDSSPLILKLEMEIFMTGNCYWDEKSPKLIQRPNLSVESEGPHTLFAHNSLIVYLCVEAKRHGFPYSCQGCITSVIRKIYFRYRLPNLTLSSPPCCERSWQPNGILLLIFRPTYIQIRYMLVGRLVDSSLNSSSKMSYGLKQSDRKLQNATSPMPGL